MIKNILVALVLVLASCKEEVQLRKDVGVVIFKLGFQASLVKEKKTETIELGKIVEVGDVIITDENSSVDIQFDNSIVRVQKNSTFKVKSLGQNKSFRLENGKIFANVNKRNKDNTFNISTPAFVAGVRGTTYSIEVDELEHYNTTFKVYEGSISISGEDKNETFISAGEGIKADLSHISSISFQKEYITFKDEMQANSIAPVNATLIDDYINSESSDDLKKIIANVTSSQNVRQTEWRMKNHSSKKIKSDFLKYYGRIENVVLVDGKTIEGVITFQDEKYSYVDTLNGKIRLDSEEISEVIYK